MVDFSIVMPTYNRADVIERALASVVAQTHQSWELIVVDDGSIDSTEQIVRRFDERVRYTRQVNAGCYVARNAGMACSTGRWITFLDSDDEWLPHNLELVYGFFNAHPTEHFLMTEFWSDSGDGHRVRNDFDLFENRWPVLAKAIGSTALDLPAGESDPYLRVFQRRESVGSWGAALAARLGLGGAFRYSGRIRNAFRWGHLGWLPTTTVSRTALQAVGPFKDSVRTAADYNFLAALSDKYDANMLAIPCAVKHERSSSNARLREDHLASGRNEYRYAATRIKLLEEVFPDPNGLDEELARIKGLFHYYAGKTALRLGKRREALEHLERSCRALPGLTAAAHLRRLAAVVPSGRLAGLMYRSWRRIADRSW